jgi:hypothetical protein
MRRARRALRNVAIALLGAWALYLVAVNVFVGTRLLRNLTSYDPGALRVEYDRAYSILPGRIHVEGLRIRGRDSNVEWLLTIDRCDFGVVFRDLLQRRFHATHVRGDGLSLHARQRRPTFTPDEADALPPVDGFSDPPYASVPPPAVTDAEYNLWSIWLEDVVADHVRDIWVDTLRYAGDARVSGRWYFRPVRWLEVGPARRERSSRRAIASRCATSSHAPAGSGSTSRPPSRAGARTSRRSSWAARSISAWAWTASALRRSCSSGRGRGSRRDAPRSARRRAGPIEAARQRQARPHRSR